MSKSIAMMVAVLLVALVQSTNAVDCLSVVANILPCSSFLGNSVPILPGTQCCDAASSVVDSGDTESLCQCFRLSPLGSGFLPSKAQQLPSLCNVTSFMPLVNCLIPSAGSAVPLPPLPLVPLPPLISGGESPLIPLTPLIPGESPLVPLPPLIPGLGPLPPLIPGLGPLPPLIPGIPPLVPVPPVAA